jgi:hypothetical protein
MPPFWFGLIAYDAIKLNWFNNVAVLYGLGLHSAGKSGINWDYVHLVLVRTLTIRSSRRGPVRTGVDARVLSSGPSARPRPRCRRRS